jgi:NADH-quinone oxidoreductase subunit L
MFELDIELLLVLIPALPLAAAVVTAALGPWLLRSHSHWPTLVALVLSTAASGGLVYQLQQAVNSDRRPRSAIGFEHVVALWTWADVAEQTSMPQARQDPLEKRAAQNQPGMENAPETENKPTTAKSGLHNAGGFRVQIVLRADTLTATMLAMITLVSLLVAVYAVGYMRGDSGYWRFFCYIPLFVFSMTMLVSASNFLLLYVFWEAVGLCSYLLIGFWYQKPQAAAAGKKAFLVNRVGDFGFALGVFLLWLLYGTLDFHDTIMADGSLLNAGILGQHMLRHPELYVGGGAGAAICLLLMAGACGKSAQFPLHVWLPDAMEGPTPVSALIHAATMVTAGVYLVARCMPLFLASLVGLQAVAVIGGFTALLAALIALTQTDLKRILAYSTISQLGLMFLGLGTGSLAGVVAGMFHLFTHAFFKTLLFLGAGSVMHATGGAIDIRQFRGLRRLLPITHWTFLCGCLSLAAIVPFSGFFSKDMILAAVHGQSSPPYAVLYLVALVTSLLTAFYTFRAMFCTFYGDERLPSEAGHHAHESPPVMTIPLVLLAIGALGVGGYFQWTGGFAEYLGHAPSLAYPTLASTAQVSVAGHAGGDLSAATTSQPIDTAPAASAAYANDAGHLAVALTSQLCAFAGLGLAAVLYLGKRRGLAGLTTAMDTLGLYRLSRNKFYFDELYQAVVVRPLERLASWAAWADLALIDWLVDACGRLTRGLGATLRPFQNGLVPFYALVMILGLLVLLGALMR